MLKKISRILMVIGLLSAIVISMALSVLQKYVPDLPPDTIGANAGNLQNGGLFAENDEYVFFSNTYDNGALYRMKADETELKKLTKTSSTLLCVGGDFIYYFQNMDNADSDMAASLFRTNGIYRISDKGKRAACLTRGNITALQLYGNDLYYQQYATATGTNLRHISIHKKGDEELKAGNVHPACIQDGRLYFQDPDSKTLSVMNLENGFAIPVVPHNAFHPIVKNGYLYFIDVESGYRVARSDLNGNAIELLNGERTDSFNLTDSYLYYQTSGTDSPALMRVPLSGGSAEIVAAGVYSDINVTSRYVYFHAFGEPAPLYHTPADGSINVGTFRAAAMEVAKN